MNRIPIDKKIDVFIVLNGIKEIVNNNVTNYKLFFIITYIAWLRPVITIKHVR